MILMQRDIERLQVVIIPIQRDMQRLQAVIFLTQRDREQIIITQLLEKQML
jgi:hypothetical protein